MHLGGMEGKSRVILGVLSRVVSRSTPLLPPCHPTTLGTTTHATRLATHPPTHQPIPHPNPPFCEGRGSNTGWEWYQPTGTCPRSSIRQLTSTWLSAHSSTDVPADGWWLAGGSRCVLRRLQPRSIVPGLGTLAEAHCRALDCMPLPPAPQSPAGPTRCSLTQRTRRLALSAAAGVGLLNLHQPPLRVERASQQANHLAAAAPLGGGQRRV